jgi:hypothetical protein
MQHQVIQTLALYAAPSHLCMMSVRDHTGRNLSPKVASIVYCRQLKGRVDSILAASAAFLRDLPSFDSFEGLARGLQARCYSRPIILFSTRHRVERCKAAATHKFSSTRAGAQTPPSGEIP